PFYVPCRPDKQTNLRSKDLLSFCSNGGVEVGIQLLVQAIERTPSMNELNLACWCVIGKAGGTIRTLKNSSGARIQITRDAEADPHSASNQGIVVAMIVPMVWQKYDYKIREHGKRLQKQSNGFYTMIDARVVQKIKSKFNVILV
ncbi:reticulon-like protein B13, partial [Tanacetum coccineum]